MINPLLNAAPFIGLVAGCLMLWIPTLRPHWLVAVVFSIAAALYNQLLEYIALPFIFVLILVALWYQNSQKHASFSISNNFTVITLAVLSLAFGAHWIPGIHRLNIFNQIKLSADSVPFSFYFNFDKTLAGLVLLATVTPLAASAQQWKALSRSVIKGSLMAILLLLPSATMLGLVTWDPKLPSWLPTWLVANLFFTCIAEETFFRGLIQKRLLQDFLFKHHRYSPVLAISLTSILFGLLHGAAGYRYALVACAAGVIYGWVYYRSGRIEASILVHWILNTSHFLLMTYPNRL